MQYIDYLKENFTTPSAAFNHLEMKSYLDNQIYFSQKFKENNCLLVEKLNFIQHELQMLFDNYFNIGSDYFKQPSLYQKEITKKVKKIFQTDILEDEMSQAIYSMLSLDPVQQKILSLPATYEAEVKHTWKEVQNFIDVLQIKNAPFVEYDIKWQDYVEAYDLTFLTINQVYDPLALSHALIEQMGHIQKSLNVSKKHIGQGKLGLSINHVHQYEAVFYPNEFMAIKFKNIYSVKQFLGHEWMHFIDRLMGLSLIEAKILPKDTTRPEITLVDESKLSALKQEKLRILYPNTRKLIDLFQQPKYLSAENFNEFKEFTKEYFQKFNISQYIECLQKYHVLKPIVNLDEKVKVFLNDELLYKNKFVTFLSKCFEKNYPIEHQCFLYAQFDTLMYLKKIAKKRTVSDEEKIDINLFHYYAKECDSYLKQINSTIYPPNYTTNLLEMLARSFETFLNEKKDEKPEFNPYFALPQGIEKHDFYKKWKKVGYEIKKAHIIINPKEYEPLKIHHVSQKKKNIK